MAEDFKALITAQKETNKKLDQLVAAADPSGSAAKEDKSDAITQETKRTNLLKKMAGGLADLAKGWKDAAKAKMKGLSGGLVKFLKGVAIAGLMVALLAFLESDTWKSMKETIVDDILPKLKTFWTKTLKPFLTGILDFIKDPSWENFKNIFDVENPLGLVVGLVGITALLAPGLLFLGLKLGIKTFRKALNLLGSGLSAMIPTGGGAKPGSVVGKGKNARLIGVDGKKTAIKPGDVKGKAGIMDAAKKQKGVSKGLMKGVLRGAVGVAKFLGPVGLAITGIMGVIDGVSAGMEEAKKESSTKLTIMKAATAGVISGLTFGLVEQKTIENALSGMGDNLVKFTNWIYTPGAGSPGGTTSAKLFGISLGFPNISELFKAGWNKLGNFFTGIAKWIYTPGAAATMGGGGTPAKLFGVELKFPSLNISFTGMADKILSILPKWLTDPAGYIKGLVADMAALLPGMGGDKKVSEMSKEDISGEIGDIKEKIKNTKDNIETSIDAKGLNINSRKSMQDKYNRFIARDRKIVAEQEARLKELEAAPKMQQGGPVTKGEMYNSHFSSGELFIPDNSGMILSAQRTEQIMQAGLQRGAAAGGGSGPSLVNAPVNTVNNSQSNTTVTSTELKHPSPLLAAVNLAA